MLAAVVRRPQKWEMFVTEKPTCVPSSELQECRKAGPSRTHWAKESLSPAESTDQIKSHTYSFLMREILGTGVVDSTAWQMANSGQFKVHTNVSIGHTQR